MAKNERTRTMVYSNVNKNKKADKKSASKNDIIDLNDEVVIGLAKFPEPDEVSEKKIKKKQNPKTANIKQNLKKQKIKAIKKMVTCLFLTILLFGGLVYFLLSPAFNIKTIEVINNQNISKEQIINSSGILINENMFKISTNEAEKSILTNPYIENVKVKRKFYDKIEIDVQERTATLMLEYGNSYIYINNQGYILEISANKLDAPILTGYVTSLEQIKPGNRLSKEDLERLKTVLNIIECAKSNNIADLITKIDIHSKKNYKLTIESEDKIVYLGSCSDLSTQMLYVKEMLERETGIEGEFFVDMDLNEANPVFREKV